MCNDNTSVSSSPKRECGGRCYSGCLSETHLKLKPRPPIASMSFVKSFWNFAQSKAVILPCSVQNFKTICQITSTENSSRVVFKTYFGRIPHIAPQPVDHVTSWRGLGRAAVPRPRSSAASWTMSKDSRGQAGCKHINSQAPGSEVTTRGAFMVINGVMTVLSNIAYGLYTNQLYPHP